MQYPKLMSGVLRSEPATRAAQMPVRAAEPGARAPQVLQTRRAPAQLSLFPPPLVHSAPRR
jgi:hypothetical protein